MRHYRYAIIIILALLWSRASTAAEGDNHWHGFHLRDVNGPVYTIVRGPDNSMYIGGSFTEAGGIAAQNIARWHNGAWEALGSGVTGGNTPAVYTIAVTQHNVVAGGSFTAIGGNTANNIAYWNGIQWTPLGNGTNDAVYALAVGNNAEIYVGGAFTVAGGISGNGIALWQEGEWKSVGDGVEGANQEVRALLFADNTLYAAGNFARAGNVETPNIAQWNGSEWRALGSGIEPYNATVYSLAIHNTIVYASGFLSADTATQGAHIRSWNGKSWTVEGICDDAVRALAFLTNGTLAAAGDFTKFYNTINASVQTRHIALKVSGQWQEDQGGINQRVHALALDTSGALLVGGEFNTAGTTVVNYLARFAFPNVWKPLDITPNTSVDGSVYATAIAPNGDLYIGGNFTIAGTTTANAIARWDGQQWHALGSGIQGTVYALAVDKKGLVYAGGNFGTAGETMANAIARWDGTQWHSLNTNTAYMRVFALAISDEGILYAGGQFAHIGSTAANRIARWNGVQWSAMHSGVDGAVYAIAWKNGRLYIGGEFTNTIATPLHGIAEWDGTQWRPIQQGVDGSVFALAVDNNNNLYAAGDFSISKAAINKIAVWNGSRWSPLGTGMNHDITALALDSSDNLYAAGYFSIAGGKNISHIAVWKANTWQALGSGVDAAARAMAATANALYAVGSLRSAGNQPTHNIARWQLCNLAPTVIPSGSMTICHGEMATLRAPDGFATYQWSTGETTQTLTVAKKGEYSVVVTNTDGCTEQSPSVFVDVVSVPLVLPTTLTVCAGDSVHLAASGAQIYTWEPAATLSCPTCATPWALPTTTTTYTVTALYENCATTATVLVRVLDDAPQPSITAEGSLLTSSPATAYQWFYNNHSIPGATSQTYMATKPGVYAVQTSNAQGCTAMSQPVEIATNTAVMQPPPTPQLSYSYNADDKQLLLEWSALSPTALTVRIVDVTGRTVLRQHSGTALHHTLPMYLNIATGVYLLVVESDTETTTRTLLLP